MTENKQWKQPEMSAEEFLEHVKIDGCLTVEGKQYVEMKDVLLLIEMALEQNGQINTRIAETSSDKTDQHQTIIDGLKKDLKDMHELADDYEKMLGNLRKENEVLRKQAADYTPMKSMADYTEKIQHFSEQAEDMFGLYIDTIRLERVNTMFCLYWKVDMKTSGCKKPIDNIDKQSANY